MKARTGILLVLSAKGTACGDYLAGRFHDANEAEDFAACLRDDGEDARVVPELVECRSDGYPGDDDDGGVASASRFSDWE